MSAAPSLLLRPGALAPVGAPVRTVRHELRSPGSSPALLCPGTHLEPRGTRWSVVASPPWLWESPVESGAQSPNADAAGCSSAFPDLGALGRRAGDMSLCRSWGHWRGGFRKGGVLGPQLFLWVLV